MSKSTSDFENNPRRFVQFIFHSKRFSKDILCKCENLFEYSTVQLLFSLAKYKCFKCLESLGPFFLLRFGSNISGVCVCEKMYNIPLWNYITEWRMGASVCPHVTLFLSICLELLTGLYY